MVSQERMPQGFFGALLFLVLPHQEWIMRSSFLIASYSLWIDLKLPFSFPIITSVLSLCASSCFAAVALLQAREEDDKHVR